MSDGNVPTEPTDPEDPWSPSVDGPDLGARRRKSFDADGRAIRPESPSWSDPQPQASTEPNVVEAPSWAQPAQPEPQWDQAAPPESQPQPPPNPQQSWGQPQQQHWDQPQWNQPQQSAPSPDWTQASGAPGWDQPPGSQNNWQQQPGNPPVPTDGWAPTPPGHTPFFQPGIGYFGTYAEPSQAGLALGLSIGGLASIAICGLGLILCPIGWFIASRELKGIRDGRRNPSNQGSARAGQVIGIIGTALIALGILGVLLVIGFG